jgi:hypothetical protein
MDPQNLQDLSGMREKPGVHENQAQRNLRRRQLPSQVLRKLPQAGFIKVTRPMPGNSILITHTENVIVGKGKAKAEGAPQF